MNEPSPADPTRSEEAPAPSGQPQNEQPAKKKGCCGCWVVLLILLSLLIGGAVALRLWVPALAADFVGELVDEKLAELDLPPEEQESLRRPVDKLTEAIRHEKIGFEDIETLVEKLRRNPAIPAIGVRIFERRYVDLRMQDPELTAARLTTNRFVQGLLQQRIPDGEIQALFARCIEHHPDAEPHQQYQLAEDLSAEDVAEILAAMEQAADQAGVPEARVEIDYGALLEQALDEALVDFD